MQGRPLNPEIFLELAEQIRQARLKPFRHFFDVHQRNVSYSARTIRGPLLSPHPSIGPTGPRRRRAAILETEGVSLFLTIDSRPLVEPIGWDEAPAMSAGTSGLFGPPEILAQNFLARVPALDITASISITVVGILKRGATRKLALISTVDERIGDLSLCEQGRQREMRSLEP